MALSSVFVLGNAAPEDLPPAGRAGLSPAPDHTGAHVMNIGQAAQATGISAKMIRTTKASD